MTNMTIPHDDPRHQAWLRLTERVRDDPSVPFDEQWEIFCRLAAERDVALGPMPAWWPDRDRIADSNIGRLIAELGLSDYEALHRWSVDRREAFWRRVVEGLSVHFDREPERVLDAAAGPTAPRWLPGARMNIVDSCFQPPACTIAVAVGREGSAAVETVTYGELESLVHRVSNGLTANGFSPGDGIALYMPMNLECVAAYLGVIRAGCYVVSIADSFAAHEVARRLEIGGAKGAITVGEFDRGGKAIPLYDTLRSAGAPRTIVVGTGDTVNLRQGDILWSDFLGDDSPVRSVMGDPDTTINVLFSSGTTGDPKAIPWSHLTAIKAAADGHLHQDLGPGSVAAWPTNIGWMMGPWLIFATLMNRAALALYEGLPTGEGFTTYVEHTGVTMLGVVPSLVRAWRQSGACDGANWNGIEIFSSTGEPSNRSDFLWLMSRAGYRAPVVEYCGGTEIGGGYITGSVVQPSSPATFSTPALGLDLVLLDGDGTPVDTGTDGEVFLIPPSIGLSQTLLNRDHDEVYYDGCPPGPEGQVLRRHGDQLERLPRGYYRAHGRADDTMNLGGIKVSSVELETVIDQHEAISESAAVAVQPGGEGADRLVVFAVLRNDRPVEQLKGELNQQLAATLNPLFKIHDVVAVDSMPRTASNKLMRRTLRARYMERGSL